MWMNVSFCGDKNLVQYTEKFALSCWVDTSLKFFKIMRMLAAYC
mgnify:FL=1